MLLKDILPWIPLALQVVALAYFVGDAKATLRDIKEQFHDLSASLYPRVTSLEIRTTSIEKVCNERHDKKAKVTA